jgi:hypothetical protein
MTRTHGPLTARPSSYKKTAIGTLCWKLVTPAASTLTASGSGYRRTATPDWKECTPNFPAVFSDGVLPHPTPCGLFTCNVGPHGLKLKPAD